MPQIDQLPPLREVIQRLELKARKSLGQNFLCDLNLTSRIARAAGPLENSTVLEIGPGPGGLTRAILALNAKKVIAVEKDHRFAEALEEIAQAYPQKLTVMISDAMEVDRGVLPSSPVKVIANLPYNMATPLLIKWLSGDTWPPWWESMTLMFQKEVADRIVAEPNSKSYGRLSVISNWRSQSRKLFDVPAAAFTPQPKVTSTVVKIEPLEDFKSCSFADLEKVTAAAFGQRRKMLRSSLKSLAVDTSQLMSESEISATDRAEAIPISGFIALAQAYRRQAGNLK